jgi:1,4-dihydroxy-6-naphthoate synthase
MLIRLGHSPDPDDAFMFWALAEGAIDTRGFEFEHVLQDINTLSEWALEGRLETTAMSLASYPLVQDKYVLLPHGASMGSGYGPVVVGPRALSREQLRTTEVVVPGERTTAFLTLRLYLGEEFPYRVMPFDEILDEVKDGRAEAGLLIHEGQLTYEREGLAKSVDLGEWWLLETGLPLPLGVNVARRDLGPEKLRELSDVLRESIRAGLAHRQEAMRYAMRFGRGLDIGLADRFVGMYVNDLTENYGDEGKQAVRELLRRAEELGVYDEPVRVEFVQ